MISWEWLIKSFHKPVGKSYNYHHEIYIFLSCFLPNLQRNEETFFELDKKPVETPWHSCFMDVYDSNMSPNFLKIIEHIRLFSIFNKDKSFESMPNDVFSMTTYIWKPHDHRILMDHSCWIQTIKNLSFSSCSDTCHWQNSI